MDVDKVIVHRQEIANKLSLFNKLTFYIQDICSGEKIQGIKSICDLAYYIQ